MRTCRALLVRRDIRMSERALEGEEQPPPVAGERERLEAAIEMAPRGDRGQPSQDLETRGTKLDSFGNDPAATRPAALIRTRDGPNSSPIQKPPSPVAAMPSVSKPAGSGGELAAVEVEGGLAAGLLAAGNRQTGERGLLSRSQRRDRVEKLDPVLADAQPGDAGADVGTRHHLGALATQVRTKLVRAVALDQGLHLDVGPAVADAPDDVGWIPGAPGEAGAEAGAQHHRARRELKGAEFLVGPGEAFEGESRGHSVAVCLPMKCPSFARAIMGWPSATLR